MALHHSGALAAVALLTAYFLYQKISRYAAISRFKKEHGCVVAKRFPQYEPVFGFYMIWQFRKHHKANDLPDFTRGNFISQKTNTMSITIFNDTTIMTCDPRNIKAVLATQFEDFALGHRQVVFGPLLGDGIFTTDGAAWQHSRALVRPAFTRSQVADLEMFDTYIEQLLDQIPRDGSTVDLGPLFFRMTLDVALEFLFGVPADSSDAAAIEKRKEFGAAFDYAQNKLGDLGTHGWSKYILSKKRFWKSCKTAHDFADELIANAQRQRQQLDGKTSLDNEEKSDGRYVFLDELAGATSDPKRIRDELLNILLAGRDTTASLLTMSFHVLAKRPDIWKKLKHEVDSLNGQKPEYEQLKDMKYLRYFMNESLRLYPVVPGNGRMAVKDTTLPFGGGPDGETPVFVAKGQRVFYSPYSMHRSEEHYGPDSLEFKPERWEDLRTGWQYLPFNGGPRICVGQQFALAEASYAVIRILQSFREIESRDPEPFKPLLGLTMSSKNGAKVSVKV